MKDRLKNNIKDNNILKRIINEHGLDWKILYKKNIFEMPTDVDAEDTTTKEKLWLTTLDSATKGVTRAVEL